MGTRSRIFLVDSEVLEARGNAFVLHGSLRLAAVGSIEFVKGTLFDKTHEKFVSEDETEESSLPECLVVGLAGAFTCVYYVRLDNVIRKRVINMIIK